MTKIPENVIKKIVEGFDNAIPYSTKLRMKKVRADEALRLITPYLPEEIRKRKYVGGNLYEHDKPYLPHVDHQESWGDDSIVVVIPLRYSDSEPRLVVFDQTYDIGPITWCMNLPALNFDVNRGEVGRPCDTKGVNGLSNKPIPEELYSILNHFDKDLWFGLTGESYAFKPGNVISFNANRIHATANFTGIKLGLTLRYGA